MSTRPLTPKQQRFVEEYLKDLCATRAAIRAGYSEKTAEAIGRENLGKPRIAEAVEAALAERSARVQVDADYVLRNTVEVLERCMQRAPVLVRRGRDMVQMVDDEGRDVWAFDAKGALGALEKLARHVRFYPPERMEVTGKDGAPLAVAGVDLAEASPEQLAAAAAQLAASLGLARA